MLTGQYKATHNPILKILNNQLTTITDISNCIAENWSDYASNSSFSVEFISKNCQAVDYKYIQPHNIFRSAALIESPIASIEIN